MEYEGFRDLGDVLNNRTNEVSKANDTKPFEFGVINADYSLKTDRYQFNIPKGDYMVASPLLGSTAKIQTSTAYPEAHSHTVDVSTLFPKLKPGDRVAVAWYGNEAVVLAVLINSSKL